MSESVRLNKFISEAGVASRRAADRMVDEGRITINGKVAVLGDKVCDGDVVCVDGKPVTKVQEDIILVFHKPRGITCTSNPDDKDNVIDFIGYPKRIYSVGRLDKDSEGMLVFTNDGEFANKVMHPRNSVYKFYRVTVRPGITEEQLVKLETGVEIDGKKTAPAIVHVLVQDKEANRVVLEMILHEGKNREIRKMCAAVGLEVARLRRTQIGGVKMGMLKQGDWRDLTEKEVKNLLANPIVNGRVI